MEEERFGHLEIKLNEQLQQKGLNNIARLDVYVLCKLCTVLDCRIEDLLEFHPFAETADTQESK